MAKSALGLKIIGIMKLVSATLLACIALGIFRFIGHGMGEDAQHLAAQLHLDPQKHLIHEALGKLTGANPKKLKEIGVGTFFYAGLYMVEGIGLLKGKHWAEYLTIIATGSFLPLEVYEICMKFSAVRIGVFLVNVAIVIYLIRQLKRDRHPQ